MKKFFCFGKAEKNIRLLAHWITPNEEQAKDKPPNGG